MADKYKPEEKVVSQLYDTLELRLTDEQIAAIRLRVQRNEFQRYEWLEQAQMHFLEEARLL